MSLNIDHHPEVEKGAFSTHLFTNICRPTSLIF